MDLEKIEQLAQAALVRENEPAPVDEDGDYLINYREVLVWPEIDDLNEELPPSVVLELLRRLRAAETDRDLLVAEVRKVHQRFGDDYEGRLGHLYRLAGDEE